MSSSSRKKRRAPRKYSRPIQQTDADTRREIQCSGKSSRALARELHRNRKTIARWKHKKTVQNSKTGPKPGTCRALSEEQETMIVAFRNREHLSVDRCLSRLKPNIPGLTRSTLYRCLKRDDRRLADLKAQKHWSRKMPTLTSIMDITRTGGWRWIK